MRDLDATDEAHRPLTFQRHQQVMRRVVDEAPDRLGRAGPSNSGSAAATAAASAARWIRTASPRSGWLQLRRVLPLPLLERQG